MGIQPPHLLDYDDTPLYNTQAVVRLTQVQAPRLRAWERRYAFLMPQRNTNSYRLYSERDVVSIRWLRDQVDAGMTISQATAYLRDAAATKSLNGATPDVAAHADLASMVQDLFSAAKRLDEPSSYAILRAAFALHSVEDVCLQLISPVLGEVGMLWREDDQMILVEHFLTGIVRTQLDAIFHGTLNPTSGPLVMIGAAPGEIHEMGVLMMALFLRRNAVRVTFLGANLPRVALVRMVADHRPAVIGLSVTLPEFVVQTLDVARELSMIQGLTVFIGGQAITPEMVERFPPRVQHIGGNALQAVATIKKAL